MAEDDEIDILGDFSLDNLLSKNDTAIFDNASLVSQNSELLKCDYTIHPQWLLDKPSTNPALWYSSTNSDFTVELAPQSEIECAGSDHQVSTANSITDESGWTEKEKNLLSRGIEIFGRSNVRLSQFIGSRSAAEVKYFLKNFYSDVQVSYGEINNDIVFDNNCAQESIVMSQNLEIIGDSKAVLDDTEIPASIEEVIAVVSTAQPTVSSNVKKVKLNKSEINYKDIPSGHSLLKSNYFHKKSSKTGKFKKTVGHKSRALTQKTSKENSATPKSVKFKFKTKLKLMKGHKVVKGNINKRKKQTKSELMSENKDILIITGKGLSVPVCDGEEVIKIKKESMSSDSDIEVDIEDCDDTNDAWKVEARKSTQGADEAPVAEKQTTAIVEDGRNVESKSASVTLIKKIPELSELSKELAEELTNMDVPKSDCILDENKLTDLERFFHFEFFEGRSAKTPRRYMKIRNHILNVWKNIKPTYVTKTSIRQGLKQCGDVNCIGRIHQFLEQIGAINFNCSQTTYVRPLYDIVVGNYSAPKEKVVRDVEVSASSLKSDVYRVRNKKRYIVDGEGGCTLTHDERGDIINTTIVNEDPIQKHKTYLKKPVIRLIYCRPFKDDRPQEYTIHLNLAVLLLMDLHAHTSLSEVMGLVGGQWDKRQKILTISRYEPCKNIAASSTHCDMCPVSQAKATDILHEEHLDVLGWYHSHPTFAPEPSQQDIETQLSVQQWIGNERPCVGLILSPFSLHGALIASPYRCMIVDRKANFEDQYVPFKFKVDVVSSNFNLEDFLNRAWRIYNSEYVGLKECKVNIYEPYFQDHSINYLDKFISSIKMHLAKCSNVNKMTCDAIVRGLSDICSNNL